MKLKLKPGLRSKAKILAYAGLAGSAGEEYDECMEAMKPKVCKQGHLTKPQLKKIALWKSRRRADYVDYNSPGYVKNITAQAFASEDPGEKIKLLDTLHGVGRPTASAILHWFDKDVYPIWDFRALWSCSVNRVPYCSLPRWKKYVDFCSATARCYKVDKRTLDRALWHYSKKHQPPPKRKKYPVVPAQAGMTGYNGRNEEVTDERCE